MKLAEALLIVARREVGTTEVGQTNRGERVDDYHRATHLDPKDWGAWCAAFVCWCVREAMIMANIKEHLGFCRPQNARAWDLEKWSLAQDGSTATRKPAGHDIRPGDLIIFTFRHTGFATSPPDKDGWFFTIEGNSNARGSRTGGMVCIGCRHIAQVRSRIRFML